VAILSRILQKVFGASGATNKFGVIGSDNAGSPQTTKDLDLIQSLTDYYDVGLFPLTNDKSEPPRIEDFNALFFLITSQLKYLFQNGIPEWIATENYYANISYVTYGGVLYQALTGTELSPNINIIPSSDPTKWRDLFSYYLGLAESYSLGLVSAEAILSRNADNLSSGTIPDARFPSTLPELSGSLLTDLSSVNIIGALPENINGRTIKYRNSSGVESTKVKFTKEIEIGDWNMDSSDAITVNHGVTNWKSIRILGITIRDDNDTQYCDKDYVLGTGAKGCGVNLIGYTTYGETFLTLGRLTSGAFDTTAFKNLSYNRGWVLIEYEA